MAYSGASPGQLPASIAHGQFHYDPSTPPPPPPKPSSGPNSGRDTPLRGPPVPPPPPGQFNNGQTAAAGGENASYGQAPDTGEPLMDAPPPGWLPSMVHELSMQDLRELVENQTLQQALLNNPDTSHPSIAASQEPLRHMLDSNIALASSLQQMESRLSHQRAATQSRLLALRALEQQHKSKISETEHALRNFSPMALYQRLAASVQEQDSLVRGIEESFLDEGGLASDKDVSDFIRRLRDARALGFLRSQRKQRWDEGRVGGWR